MIFHPTLARLIRDGEKTQHRIPIGEGEHACRHQPGQVRRVQPARQRPAQDPNRPPRTLCRIHITDVTRDLLGNVNDDDAQAEGFTTFDAYLNDWQARHGLDDWPLEQPVWVLSFELYTPSTVRREAPLYLHAGIIGGHRDDDDLGDELADRGYTTNAARALVDAGEVIDAGRTTDAFASLQRWNRDRAAAEREQAEMSLAERVERSIASARAAGVDTQRYEAAILARLRALEQRTRRAA